MNPSVRPRLVFMGTPELARVVLSSLAADPQWEVVLVVAQPDKPSGRGLALQSPPVKLEAMAHGLPVQQPAKARDPDFIELLRSLTPDLIVVAAYGQLLPPAILAIPTRGCLNVHTSLLPRWRGAAPIQWAIMEGDTKSGITLMLMDAGLDTGDIVAQEETPITPEDTGQSLHDRLARLGANLLTRSVPLWLSGRLQSFPQPTSGVTYARKLTREDGRLDWSQTAVELCRRVRALNPWPGAFTTISGGPPALVQLKIWEAHPGEGKGVPGEVLRATGDELVVATGDAALNILTLQREGRRRLDATEFLKGAPLKPGDILGQPPSA